MWQTLLKLNFFILLILTTKNVNGNSLRIINGNEASPNQFPYQVAIIADYAPIHKYCGGSLISTTKVLTAAQCVSFYIDGISHYADQVKIYLGCNKIPCGKQVILADAANFKIHPDWDPQNTKNDIAIIELPTEAQLTDNSVKIIELDLNDFNHDDEVATLAGWGFTSEKDIHFNQPLRFVNLKVLDLEECARTIKDIKKSQLCTSPKNDNDEHVGLCYGDVGGPLVYEGKQIGIASLPIDDCSAATNPSVFTRVSHYKKWISGGSANILASKIFVSILAAFILIRNIF